MAEVNRIVMACGGTGGHLYPGIALARVFEASDSKPEILFVGTAAGIEARVIPEQGFSFAAVAARGFVGKGRFGQARALASLARGWIQAFGILRRFAPHLVIGVGGYASVPVILAAWLQRRPRVILEPNVNPGLANRLLAPVASLTVVAFERTRKIIRSRRVEVLGMPIRPELTEFVSSPSGTVTTLLVLGGSQGASAINRAMAALLPHLSDRKEKLFIIHQTGFADLESVRAAYQTAGFRARVEPFIEQMGEVYAQSHLVLCRAGAGTLAELTALGLPAILIPFPFASGHQEDNAREMEAAGAAKVLLQRDLTPERLGAMLCALLDRPDEMLKMSKASRSLGRPKAAMEIAEACRKLVKNKL